MESSISKALWVLTDTLPSTCLCQSHWAGCTCQQSALTSSPTAAAKLSLVCKHKPQSESVQSGLGCKGWCWGWAQGPFCQLCCVWQEPPQEQQHISGQQQSPKQSELNWRLRKTNVSAQLKWPEYLLGHLYKRIGFSHLILLSPLSMALIFLCQHVCMHLCFLHAHERKRAERKNLDVLVLSKAQHQITS